MLLLFLDACSRLYDKVCWSGRSVGRSVGLSVGQSVGVSVGVSVGLSVGRSVGPHFTPIYVGRFGLPLVGAK